MTLHRWQIMDRLHRARFLAVVRSSTPEEALEISHTLLDAGVDVLEIALTTPGALGAIEELTRTRPEALLGAGTVLDEASAVAAIRVGARLLVSPSLDVGVVRAAHRYGAVAVPGCATPTEMLAAIEAGADAVKLFPASSWTPGDLRGVLAALPHLAVIPTGGVRPEDLGSWLDAGAIAVGMGGALTGQGRVAAAATARRILADIAAA